MVSTDPEAGVDVSPIVVTEIEVGGSRLVATEPVSFDVAYEGDEAEALFAIEGEFGIILAAPTRAELEVMLEDEFVFLWEHFAQGDPTLLDPMAVELGADLRERFMRPSSATQVA